MKPFFLRFFSSSMDFFCLFVVGGLTWPERFCEPLREGRPFRDDLLRLFQSRDMDDERIVGGSSLRVIDPSHCIIRECVCSKRGKKNRTEGRVEGPREGRRDGHDAQGTDDEHTKRDESLAPVVAAVVFVWMATEKKRE